MQTQSPKSRKKSYEQRTGMTLRGAAWLAAGLFGKTRMTEDADGNLIRDWDNTENGYTHDDIKSVLAGRAALEEHELLTTIPPRAIRYCQTKGWILQRGHLFFVTKKAWIELNLPSRLTGGPAKGQRIRFLEAPARKG